MKRTTAGAVAVAVVVALASPAVVGAADDPVVSATASGDTVTITLETVPDAGLSGFDLTVETTSDVTIESTEIGSDFPVGNSDVLANGQSATVKGSDATSALSGGETDVTLATIRLSESVDEPPITISFSDLQSDGSGSQYDPTIRIGDDDGSSGDDAETTTTPTPTTETETTTTDEGGAGPIGGETDLTTTDDETTTESDSPEETTTTSDTTTTETTTEQSTDTATETDGDGGAPATTGSGPGFGVTLALAALAAIGLFARVRPY